ncbi:transcriptional regulator [Marinilongibacter aquaticus]|uniref:winged helix-turn-helix domain-containing protein n=1 Tax=Marinilongibacter aquaticus TaxID=2975157 RepID=UPI0021BDDDC9|nr:transcriptional regulator [Marinilongibacter aquaticus]UBM61033.1 transcriptional regulator [Marinilongibacter aquaticus]
MNLENFDKAFENKVRLGIMSVLMVNDAVSFNDLKDLLEVTDGNLASHIKALEKAEYIEVRKEFVDRKPNTSYLATTKGKKAFDIHLAALEAILKRHS